jgi:multidrug transporter EmrE-like cation transporter
MNISSKSVAAKGARMSHRIAGILFIVSGLIDVSWAVSVKYADGYMWLGWPLMSLVLIGAFIYLLGRVLEVSPVGTACTLRTGVGAVGHGVGYSPVSGVRRRAGTVIRITR